MAWFRWGSGDGLYIGLLRRRVPSGCTCLLCRIRGDLALFWCVRVGWGAKLKAPCGVPDQRLANGSSQPCLEGFSLHRHRDRAGGRPRVSSLPRRLRFSTDTLLCELRVPCLANFRLSTSEQLRNGSHVSCAPRLTFSLRELQIPSRKPPTSQLTTRIRSISSTTPQWQNSSASWPAASPSHKLLSRWAK